MFFKTIFSIYFKDGNAFFFQWAFIDNKLVIIIGESKGDLGLGSYYWHEIIGILREIIPVYDQVNRAISLGKDSEYRGLGIRKGIKPGNLVLDAGSGYGNMSSEALRQCHGDLRIVMLDPITEMLSKAKDEFHSRNFLSSAIYEFLPFTDNTFDAIMCGYSFRDSINMRSTIAEFHRVLKVDGRLIIVDIGKPDNSLQRAIVAFYLKYMMSLLAFFAAGSIGLKFRAIYGTYRRLPKNSELSQILKEKFGEVGFETRMMGGAVIICAFK